MLSKDVSVCVFPFFVAARRVGLGEAYFKGERGRGVAEAGVARQLTPSPEATHVLSRKPEPRRDKTTQNALERKKDIERTPTTQKPKTKTKRRSVAKKTKPI